MPPLILILLSCISTNKEPWFGDSNPWLSHKAAALKHRSHTELLCQTWSSSGWDQFVCLLLSQSQAWEVAVSCKAERGQGVTDGLRRGSLGES